MKGIIFETLIDTIKLIPFLFVAFLIIEYIEHKITKRSKEKIEHTVKYGPVIGSILGAVPQCGFSVLATNLYATRIITLGTLIAIYLSTSDEMLPILLSQKVNISTIFLILLVKIIIGMLFGIIIDWVLKRKNKIVKSNIKHFCHDEHCHCEKESILISAIKHTVNIIIFIFIITFILNSVIYLFGEDNISKIFLKGSIFSPFISSLVGLFPNCASSVMITQLYLSNIIDFASLLSGLLTGSGVALIVLFKTNKNLKENITILVLLYTIGVTVGIISEILTLF